MTTRRWILRSAATLAALATLGAGAGSALAENMTLRLGWQKGSVLSVIKARGDFERKLKEKGVDLTWTEFPAGPQMLEGLNVGAIDFGVVGETPPVFAQAAGADLVYAGAEPPAPQAEAILVPKDSPIRSVAELKGKKVALNKGSNVHFLLVRALEKAGLAYSDIEPVFLKPSDARAAFEKGAVDAWVIWDPYYAAAEAQIGARKLVDGVGAAANYNFYIAAKPFATAHGDVLKAVIEAIAEDDHWIAANLDAAADVVAPQIGLPKDVALAALKRYTYDAKFLTAEAVANQQAIADVFAGLKLIPAKLDIASVVWQPAPAVQ